MKHLRELPLRWKLTIVITAAVEVFLAASFLAFFAFDLSSTRAAMTREVTALADVVGSASGAALAFRDAEAARQTLEAFGVRPNIVAASLHDLSGEPLAGFRHDGKKAEPLGTRVVESAEFRGGRLLVRRPVRYRGSLLGSVALEADLSEMNARTMRFGSTSLLLFAAAAGAGILLASRLQRVVSVPILALAGAAQKVTREKAYGVRVAKSEDDEIGGLTDAFNGMLEEVQSRDQALQQAQGKLTSHVVELQAEVAERVKAQDALRQREEEYRHLAFHDPLTSLPNRALFHDRLSVALARATRARTRMAVLFLDVDRFKVVNDSMGHKVGDELLQAFARRLKGSLREEDTLARLGGDEFVILLPQIVAISDAVLLAQRILASLDEPFPGPGADIFVSASIGISFYPDDGQDAGTLLRNADTAMYRAKELGRGTYQLYEVVLHKRMLHRITLERELRLAIQREELTLLFQPVLSVATGRIVAAEALARWKHADLGDVSPDVFIPLAEETGLIFPLGAWVLESACREAVHWRTQGLQWVRVLVNISTRQFLQKDFLGSVTGTLERTGLPPSRLELELTESVVINDVETTIDRMKALRELGMRVAIDDFGTGYSSLSYLRRLPFDTVKLDRSFVADLSEGGRDAAIAQAIVAMGHSLGADIVAEGVETEEQRAAICALGCDMAQGFLLGRPLPALDMREAFRVNAQRSRPMRRLIQPS